MRKIHVLAFALGVLVLAARPDRASAGLLDLIYVTGGLGFETVDLQTVNLSGANVTGDALPGSVSGVAPQLAAGVRFLFLTAGVRASVGFFDDNSKTRTVNGLQLWNV